MSSRDMVRRAREQVGTGTRPGKRPSMALAVVTCMDTRLDPLQFFQSRPGDIHAIENAGGLVTDDVIRSLLISQRHFGTRRVAVVMHTDCGLLGVDNQAEASTILDETGIEIPFMLGGFTDIRERLAESVLTVRATPLLPHRDDVRGYVYDVDTLRLTEVTIG